MSGTDTVIAREIDVLRLWIISFEQQNRLPIPCVSPEGLLSFTHFKMCVPRWAVTSTAASGGKSPGSSRSGPIYPADCCHHRTLWIRPLPGYHTSRLRFPAHQGLTKIRSCRSCFGGDFESIIWSLQPTQDNTGLCSLFKWDPLLCSSRYLSQGRA